MKNTIDAYVLIFINQTDKAILAYETDPDQGIWFPKSQIEYDETEINCAIAGDDIELNIPDWLAEEKGLI
jgi:hypothetical protein